MVLTWLQSLVRRPRGLVISGNALDYTCPSPDTAHSTFSASLFLLGPCRHIFSLFLNTFGPPYSEGETTQCQRRCEKLVF